jgi:hypothetical protein
MKIGIQGVGPRLPPRRDLALAALVERLGDGALLTSVSFCSLSQESHGGSCNPDIDAVKSSCFALPIIARSCRPPE